MLIAPIVGADWRARRARAFHATMSIPISAAPNVTKLLLLQDQFWSDIRSVV